MRDHLYHTHGTEVVGVSQHCLSPGAGLVCVSRPLALTTHACRPTYSIDLRTSCELSTYTDCVRVVLRLDASKTGSVAAVVEYYSCPSPRSYYSCIVYSCMWSSHAAALMRCSLYSCTTAVNTVYIGDRSRGNIYRVDVPSAKLPSKCH